MNTIHIYGDGGCRGNGKENALGGYGIILLDLENKRKKEIKYACFGTTNNKMELNAIIVGLKSLKQKCNVKIFTDSSYVVNGFNNGWINNWKKNNWKTAKKEPVKNKELWIELYDLVQQHNCEFNWVRGHNDNVWNERADELANIAMDELLSKTS